MFHKYIQVEKLQNSVYKQVHYSTSLTITSYIQYPHTHISVHVSIPDL